MKHLILLLGILLLANQLRAQTDSLTIESEDIIIDPIEIMPYYLGGTDSLKAFINQNINWQIVPDTIVGKVFIGFIVEPNGEITNIEIIRGLHKICDTEAIRVTGSMPKWKPGEQRGKPIRTKMVLPIIFEGKKQ